MPNAGVSAAAQEWTNADDGGFGGDAAHHGMTLMLASRGEIAEAVPRRRRWASPRRRGRALVASPSSRAGGASRRFARRSLTRNCECHRARARQAKPRIDRAARGPALDPRCARWPVRWRRDAERPFMMFDLALLGRRSNTEQPREDASSAKSPVSPRTMSSRLRLEFHRRQSSASPQQIGC